MSVFAKRRHPLTGPAFLERYADLPTKKSLIFETLTRYATIMSPRRWADTLSSHQADRFAYVRARAHWSLELSSRFADDPRALPCLAAAFPGDRSEERRVGEGCCGRWRCWG